MATSYVAAAAPAVARGALRGFALTLVAAWVAAAAVVVGFSVAPRLAGHQMLIVRSGSMEPAIRTGSAVLVRPVPPETLRAGDVITYERSDAVVSVVTHRIVAVAEGTALPTFQTKGDANNAPDPYSVTYRDTGWKVVATVPYAGYLMNALSNPSVRGMLVGVPAVILAGSFVRDIWWRKR